MKRKLKRLEANLVWILGSPRSGSTWLSAMLANAPETVRLNELSIGTHLGPLMMNETNLTPGDVPLDALRVIDVRREVSSYFFSEAYEATWLPLLRQLLLGRISAEVEGHPRVLIKEPASQGADILMAATPRSRMVFLQRDGRDVMDSELDALGKGGWIAEQMPGFRSSDEDRMRFLNARAHVWLARTRATEIAYERHPENLRVKVRYEDLLADTPAELERVASAVDLDLDAPDVARRLAFSQIPESQRGRGKFARAATPGLWRENLSEAEKELLERVMRETLAGMGYS